MNDFSRKLEAADTRSREHAQQQRFADEDEKQRQLSLERAREAAWHQRHGAAVRFAKKCQEIIS